MYQTRLAAPPPAMPRPRSSSSPLRTRASSPPKLMARAQVRAGNALARWLAEPITLQLHTPSPVIEASLSKTLTTLPRAPRCAPQASQCRMCLIRLAAARLAMPRPCGSGRRRALRTRMRLWDTSRMGRPLPQVRRRVCPAAWPHASMPCTACHAHCAVLICVALDSGSGTSSSSGPSPMHRPWFG